MGIGHGRTIVRRGAVAGLLGRSVCRICPQIVSANHPSARSSPDLGAGEHLRPADNAEPAGRGSGEKRKKKRACFPHSLRSSSFVRSFIHSSVLSCSPRSISSRPSVSSLPSRYPPAFSSPLPRRLVPCVSFYPISLGRLVLFRLVLGVSCSIVSLACGPVRLSLLTGAVIFFGGVLPSCPSCHCLVLIAACLPPPLLPPPIASPYCLLLLPPVLLQRRPLRLPPFRLITPPRLRASCRFLIAPYETPTPPGYDALR